MQLDEHITDEVAAPYETKVLTIKNVIIEHESTYGFEPGELPPEDIRKELINKIVELKYELEQVIAPNE